MKRKKIAALSALIGLVASALIVSIALGKWKGEGGKTYVTGSQITHNGKSFVRMTFGKEEIFCETASYVGEFDKETEKLTLNPNYGSCKTEALNKPVTVTVNMCSWTFFGGTAGGEGDFTNGTVTLSCPGSNALAVDVFANANEHSANKPECTYKMPDQGNTGLGEVTFTNTAGTPADVDATTEATELTYVSSGTCGVKQAEAKITGALTLKGYSDASHTKQIKLEVF